MLKRILACSFILAAFPLLTSSIHNPANPLPFQVLVFAGHTNTGGGEYCTCGCPGCSCDPGETPNCIGLQRATDSPTGSAVDPGTSPTGKTGQSGLDFGSSALMLAVALWLWTRLRA